MNFLLRLLENKRTGWLLFGVGLALTLHLAVQVFTSPSFAQEAESYTGRTPQAVVESMLADGTPASVPTEVLQLTTSGNYAISTYVYGEGGGTLVMRRSGSQWSSFCGTGGVFTGEDLVNFCGMGLTDAQALWNKYLAENPYE